MNDIVHFFFQGLPGPYNGSFRKTGSGISDVVNWIEEGRDERPEQKEEKQ